MLLLDNVMQHKVNLSCLVDVLKLNIIIFFLCILYVGCKYHNLFFYKRVFLWIYAFKIIIHYIITEGNANFQSSMFFSINSNKLLRVTWITMYKLNRPNLTKPNLSYPKSNLT